jgi:hypothetical protein
VPKHLVAPWASRGSVYSSMHSSNRDQHRRAYREEPEEVARQRGQRKQSLDAKRRSDGSLGQEGVEGANTEKVAVETRVFKNKYGSTPQAAIVATRGEDYGYARVGRGIKGSTRLGTLEGTQRGESAGKSAPMGARRHSAGGTRAAAPEPARWQLA